jgi:hypothetical protein
MGFLLALLLLLCTAMFLMLICIWRALVDLNKTLRCIERAQLGTKLRDRGG